MKVRAYEGKEKFIFVSYAHKDSKQVLDIIKKLQEQGYRVWFDEGIAPGSEWPEDIANHLKDSAMVLAFITERAVKSVNCRNEINMACSKNKPFLGIMLEEVELTSGLELQLASKQCIFRYNYATEEEFLDKVMRCPDLAPCRGNVPVKPEVQSVPVEQTVVTNVMRGSEERTGASVEVTVQEIKVTEPEKSKEYDSDTWAMTKENLAGYEKMIKRQKTTYIVIAAAVAVVGLIIGLVCFNRVKITDDVTVSRGETHLILTGQTITSEQIEQLNKLEKLRYLEFDGCAFEENAFADWESHDAITSFSVKNTDTLKDYSFLQKQPDIQYLYLISCGLSDANFSATGMDKLIRAVLENNPEFTDLSLISKKELTGLDVSGTGVEDLSLLSDAKLKTLDFSGTKVSDVTALAGVSSLISVDGSNTEVSDIAALAALQNMTELYLNGCKIQSITEPMMSLRMEKLGLANNGLQECSGFEYFTVLAEVDLGGNQLRNVDFLKKSVGTLKVLDISGNDLDETEVEFLAQCTAMEKLYLSDLPLANLDFTASMANLNTIHAIRCGLVNISGLNGSTKLNEVRLAYNDIADLTGLQNIAFDYGTILDLAYNRVTDITGLAQGKYTWLILLGNDVDYTDGAFIGVTGNHLVCHYDEEILKGELANDIFYYHYLVNCPADKQLEMQEAFDKSGVFFMNEGDMLEYLRENELDYSRWQD